MSHNPKSSVYFMPYRGGGSGWTGCCKTRARCRLMMAREACRSGRGHFDLEKPPTHLKVVFAVRRPRARGGSSEGASPREIARGRPIKRHRKREDKATWGRGERRQEQTAIADQETRTSKEATKAGRRRSRKEEERIDAEATRPKPGAEKGGGRAAGGQQARGSGHWTAGARQPTEPTNWATGIRGK